MQDLIIQTIAFGGYFGIFALMVLENVFPPIPSEVIMGIGGVLVARGQMDFWMLMLVGTVGSTLGNYFWYWVGDSFGYQRLAPVIARHGRWITLDFKDIRTAMHFFQRHGHWVVFALRFSPFLRTMVSLPAGLSHMPRAKFLAFTFAGAAIWNALLVEGGRRLAPLLTRYEGYASWVIGGLVALMLAVYVWRVLTWTPSGED